MFSRVLVPVDGSPDAGVALHHAIAIAREAGAVIHALYVADSKLIESAYRIASSPKTSAFESNPGLSGIAVAARARLADYGQRTLADAHAHCVAVRLLVPVDGDVANGRRHDAAASSQAGPLGAHSKGAEPRLYRPDAQRLRG